MTTEVKGKMSIQITIDAEVDFTINDTGTEVTSVSAAADVEGGIIALTPSIAMTDAFADRLKNVLIDSTMAYVAKKTREKLATEGLAPIIEIINEPIKGGGPNGGLVH